MAETNNFDPSLFAGLSSDPTEAVDTTPEPEPAPVEPDAPSAPEPVAPTTPEPTTTTAPVAPPTPVLEPTTLDAMTPRERALLERIEQLTGERFAAEKTTSGPPTEPVVEPTAEQPHNFLEGLNIDDVLATPENLNAVLVAVHNQAVQKTATVVAEHIMRNLPRAMETFYAQQKTMADMVDQFYKDNEPLTHFKKTVAAAANEVASENPGLSVKEVFDKAAERVYTMIGLQKEAAAKPRPTRPLAPRGTTNTGGRAQVPALQGLVGEVADLFNIH